MANLAPRNLNQDKLIKILSMSRPPKKSAPGVPTARVLATAVAQYPYNATEDTELGFPEGDTINILQRAGDWWRGELDGKVRWPRNLLSFFLSFFGFLVFFYFLFLSSSPFSGGHSALIPSFLLVRLLLVLCTQRQKSKRALCSVDLVLVGRRRGPHLLLFSGRTTP